ncbi:plastocyanin/azurin family copper-binding protein [Streptomyces naphthomycinicus]|uniref:plastocyanin/azurin family copper-binding protein n=1 Tax=Streptomyces naphthomycinicus TaxID=2872625 RepID=UPI001CEC202B|nr:plastocyanin/azurin family copper-binding protein [Streptomyces sp. TML10]
MFPEAVPGGDKALADSLSCKKLMMNPGQTHTTQIPADAPEGDYKFYCAPHRTGDSYIGELTSKAP